MLNPVMRDYQAFLFALESNIIAVYTDHPELVDHHVSKVIEGLIRIYQAKLKGKNAPELRLKGLEEELFARLNTVCQEWENTAAKDGHTYTPEIILECLKQIQKSLRLWGTDYGIRGYLNYVKPYIDKSGN